jgi:hypothetical protein
MDRKKKLKTKKKDRTRQACALLLDGRVSHWELCEVLSRVALAQKGPGIQEPFRPCVYSFSWRRCLCERLWKL